MENNIEVEVVAEERNEVHVHREYACHECGGYSTFPGYCTCGNILEEI